MILIQKTVIILKICYDLLNLSVRLPQICSYTFTDLQDHILIKLLLQWKNAKYLYLCLHVLWLFHIADVNLIEIHTSIFFDIWKCYYTVLAALAPLWILICKITQHSYVYIETLCGRFCDIAFGWGFWNFVFNWESRKIFRTRALWKWLCWNNLR